MSRVNEYAYDNSAGKAVAVDASGQQLLPANPARRHAHFGNTSASVDVFLNFGAAATAGQGIYLRAGAVYELHSHNLTHLGVYAVTGGGSASVAVQEGV